MMGERARGREAIAKFIRLRVLDWLNFLQNRGLIPLTLLQDHPGDWYGVEIEVQKQVAFAGEEFTDQPYHNGEDVYRTTLSSSKLFRLLLLTNWFVREHGKSFTQVERLMGLEGGGQIAAHPNMDKKFIDRADVASKRVDILLKHFNDTLPPSVEVWDILLQERARLYDTRNAEERYLMAYRWFGNDEGDLPVLTKLFADCRGDLLSSL
jgi:hypothetical protein